MFVIYGIATIAGMYLSRTSISPRQLPLKPLSEPLPDIISLRYVLTMFAPRPQPCELA